MAHTTVRRHLYDDYDIKELPALTFSETYHPDDDTWTVQRVRDRALEPWVTVRPSTIAGAGNGVFADRAFAGGEVIAYYTGAVVDMAYRPDIDCTYIFDLETATEEMVIDGRLCGNFVRFLNDGSIDDKYRQLPLAETRENVAFIESGVIYALRDIEVGEEMFISYGADYWAELRLKNRRTSARLAAR